MSTTSATRSKASVKPEIPLESRPATPVEVQPELQPVNQITFGAAMERLEAVVAQLEGDESLELEQALALYEQGVALAAACRRRLAHAEVRLTEIARRPSDEE